MSITTIYTNPTNQIERANYSVLSVYQKGINHVGFGIKYLVAGSEKYWLSGHLVELKPNQCLLVNHGQTITYDLNDRKQVNRGICLYFHPAEVADFAMSYSNTHELDFKLTAPHLEFPELILSDHRLTQMMTRLLQKIDKSDQPVAYWQDFKLDLLELVLDRVYADINWPDIEDMKRSNRDELIRRVSKAKEIMIASNYERPIMDAIAKEVCFSTFHFIRQFKRVTGLSPYQFWLKEMFRRAHDDLRSGNLTASECAVKCGYTDLPAFSKAFKKHFGENPSSVWNQQ